MDKPNLMVKREEIKPKLDHNITLGLLLTDADKALQKAERAKDPPIKGLFFFKKVVPTGGYLYILNGAEFPSAEAFDLLLYLIWVVEKNNWQRKLELESLNKLAKEVFGVKKLGKTERKLIERLLTIWKFHGFYFINSFLWQGKKITIQFGVIDEWRIESRGRGKPAKLEIIFNERFLEICRNTDWYRRPNWIEVKKLRKEIAKNLYLVALEYKPNEKTKDWKIYIDHDIKYWYRNTLNSLAKPESLRPSIIVNRRLKPAIEEINKKTNLRMEWIETEEGNYAISIEEVALPGSEKIEIPFDKLSDEDKAILVAYLEAVAEEKKIQNIWGFLRAMTSRQLRNWLKKAKNYYENEVKNDKETEFIEKPKLLEILRNWGKKKLEGKKTVYNLMFGEDKVLKAYENNKKVVFKCVDRIVADLLKKYAEELKEVFRKEVIFKEI
jgi:hypothetical protein